MTVGSLFSGIGGIDLGLERAGMEVRWQVEIDEFCRRVLAKHWPDVTRYEDVRDVGAHNLEPVDLIAGGFPCQDISLAGKGEGLEGERSGLWFEFARIIRELRPQFVLVENVPALTFRGLDRVLGDLAEVGYDAEWSVLSACSLGAPHTRERLFILAYTPHNNEQDAMLLQSPIVSGEPGGGCGATSRQGWWVSEPPMDRMADGLPARVVRDPLAALGNAVVPQVAEWIGRRIMEVATNG